MLMLGLTVEAAGIEQNASVAVMDFGTHEGTADPDVNLMNAERASSEYIIARLVESKKFDVMDKDIVNERIAAEGLNITGLIDPDTARRLGEILGVRYPVYGNVVDMVVDFNVERLCGKISGQTYGFDFIFLRRYNFAEFEMLIRK